MGVASAMDAYASDHSRALLTHMLIPWALEVAKLAPHKWLLPTGVQPACMMDVGPSTCGSFAVGGCHICGRPICIAHALIAADASLCCWPCMRLGAKHAKPWEPPKASGADPGVESPLDWAYEILGCDRTATDLEVKQAYRKRIASLHPDKNQGDEVHGEVVQLVTKAYDAVKASRGIA
jgi:hypothetical protein